jgi:hypothetical protein
MEPWYIWNKQGDTLLKVNKATFVNHYRDQPPNAYEVAVTHVGGFTVSTVFIGYDYTWEEGLEPLLFETSIVGPAAGKGPSYHSATPLAAKEKHRTVVRQLTQVVFEQRQNSFERVGARLLASVFGE